MSSIGINASLKILRHELEGMQRQDKALYTQLLTLQESIRGLKSELKKEREQCEEDLDEISSNEFENDVFAEGTEQNQSETVGEQNESASERNEDGFSTQETWKHDRQDSGISVKTPEADAHDMATTSKQSTQLYDFLKSSTRGVGSKPEIISHGKHEFNSHVKTSNDETPQKKTSNAKPVIIQHGKQDSGILLDEDAVRDSKLLSRLVEGSEMFEKMENRKIDRIIQNRWMKVRENSLGNRNSYQHQRSRSSNDLLLKNHPQRSLQHQYSTPSLSPRHSRTNSSPQTTGTFTAQGKNTQSFTELHNLDKQYPYPSCNNSDKLQMPPTHFRTNSCPQNLLDTKTEIKNHEKHAFKHPNELNRAMSSVEKGLFQHFNEQDTLNDEKQSAKPFNGLDKGVESNEKQNSREDKSLSENHRRSLTPSERLALPLGFNTRAATLAPKPVLQQNFSPKHHHSRSLPLTPMRGVIMAENLLSRQENRRSMQNISDFKVVPAQQVRPRKRSASFVDVDKYDSFKENNLLSQGKECTSGNTKALGNTGLSQEDGLKQAKNNNVGENKNSSKESSVVPSKTSVTQANSLKQAILNGLGQGDGSHKESTRQQHIDSSIKAKGSSHDKEKDNSNENTLKAHKANVIRVNSLPQASGNTLTQNKAKVVHINNLKSAQTQANEQAITPLRAVTVSVTEVNVSSITDRQILPRGTREQRANEGLQRRFTITNLKTDRLPPRPQTENGKLSPRFLVPRNHLRHHTAPENDVTRRRHSVSTFHAPSKSWDGYARKTTEVTKGIVRSASHVSLV